MKIGKKTRKKTKKNTHKKTCIKSAFKTSFIIINQIVAAKLKQHCQPRQLNLKDIMGFEKSVDPDQLPSS